MTTAPTDPPSAESTDDSADSADTADTADTTDTANSADTNDIADATDITDTADWWWTLVAANLAVFAAVFVLNQTGLEVPAWLGWTKFFVGVLALTAPAVVAVAVHFDRKYVASVSDWEPRSEYILLGLAMWAGIGVPLAALYLYRRHEHVGVP